MSVGIIATGPGIRLVPLPKVLRVHSDDGVVVHI